MSLHFKIVCVRILTFFFIMKTNKLKTCILSNSENFNEEIKLSQVLSNSHLNNHFWNSLRDTINLKKESGTIKGRIFTAKRILTPIIQELMKDALKQIETETLQNEKNEMNGKEMKVLYNNVNVGDVWHVQEDAPTTDGEEWALKILREISRDFEQPFDELHDKIEVNEDEQQSPKDILLNKTLLPKLLTIHQHLGNIIERLNHRCRKKRIIDTDDSLNNIRHGEIDTDTCSSTDTGSFNSKEIKDEKKNKFDVNSVGIIQPDMRYLMQKSSVSLEKNLKQLKVEHACSPISAFNHASIEKAAYSISKKLYDVAVSYHALFEENKNNAGNKEIVIKCLEDLEKVKNYLEAIRDNRECEKPKFCDLESCKNDQCLESQPHLHSNLHNMPMVLKLNEHAEDKERKSDLIIGIPNLSKSSPDVHILLNTKNQHFDIGHTMEQDNGTKSHPKNSLRSSRIPKPINKKRNEIEKFVKSKSMKITLENKASSKSKNANVLIFDPDDPCKSIIKMKEQKNEVARDSRSVVSKACFTLKQTRTLIIYLIFCYVGGTYIMWLVLKWYHEVKKSFPKCACFHSMLLYVLIYFVKFSLSLDEDKRKNLKLKQWEENYICFIPNKFWKYGPKGFNLVHDNNLRKYSSISICLNKGFFGRENEFYKENIFRQKCFKDHQPWRVRHYCVYFFECLKENNDIENRQSSTQRTWNNQSSNSISYPIWTIKRSKYYTVPQSKKKKNEDLPKKRVERDKEEPHFNMVDSLDNMEESIHETHLQISEVSLHSAESPRVREFATDGGKMCQKTEIKRKVSFREEVDVSEPDLDKEDHNLSQQDMHKHEEHHLDDNTKSRAEESPSTDMSEDIKELSTRISDLLMTDSLMKIGEDVPKRNSKRSKRPSRRGSLKSLKLTDSARHVLAKVSKTFEEEQYGSKTRKIESDVAPYFYDQKGNPITEIRDCDGEVLFNHKDDNLERLNSVLFDSEGKLLKSRFGVNGRKINVVYDEKGRLVSRIADSNDGMKNIQTDLQSIRYYDYRGKPIKYLYDSSGHEIKTVGEDLTSKIFDGQGRLQIDIYTQKGKRIDAVYDSRGRLLARVSYTQLDPLLRRDQVRVANMDDDSLSKLFESDSKSVKSQPEDIKEDCKSLKRFFDQEGNPLIGVYNKKGKALKLTSSGEADELLPFLFDTKGKLQTKRYDSKGNELKEVFGEDGKAISEMSIAWLNELLAANNNDLSHKKKKGFFFRRISLHKTKLEKVRDVEKLYDSHAKVITGVFDSTGKPLAVSMSGNAEKLIPFLFDKDGKFLKKRYNSEKRKLKCVYAKDGSIIKTISASYLDTLAAKIVSDQDKRKLEDECQMEERKQNGSSGKDSQECEGKTVEKTVSNRSLDYFEKVPDQLYDVDGNILTEIFDNEGNLLQSSNSGNAWKLLPYLFDDKGQFLETRYDSEGRELVAVFNKEGDILNNDLSAAIKIAADKTSKSKNTRHESEDYDGDEAVLEENKECVWEEKSKSDNETQAESVEVKQKKKPIINRSKHKDSVLKLGNSPSQDPKPSSQILSKLETTEKKSPNHNSDKSYLQKEKHEKKQLKPTASITAKRSIDQKFDYPEITEKSGGSIDGFYDEKGRIITELYDAKGKVLIETGDVEKLAKFLFDKDGFLQANIYNQKGRRIIQIFDQKKRCVSRISLPSIASDNSMSSKRNQKHKKSPGSVYDKDGFLVREIYDRRGHPIIITRRGRLQDLAPIIFDEKGVRRQIYNKSGHEIGPVYDHQGHILKYPPIFEKAKPKKVSKRSTIFSKSGKPLMNFYDSDGTLIIALYNDYGKTLCSVKKGVSNVELLSNFFFDKDGNFLQGRFYNYRGRMIKHVYDSEGNIIQTIKRTELRKNAHHKTTHEQRNKVSLKRNTDNINRLNLNMNSVHEQKHQGYHEKSEVRSIENIILSSQSDTIVNLGATPSQRSMSAYSLSHYPIENELGGQSSRSSITSLMNMSVKKFYDENGRILTGICNSKTRLLGYSASGNARVLAPYLFDPEGIFVAGRYHLDRRPLHHVYDSNGKLVDKISKHALKSTEDENRKMRKNLSKKLSKPKKGVSHRKRNHKDLGMKQSVLNNLKDKILTVIFDNQHRISKRISLPVYHKRTKNKRTRKNDNKSKRKYIKPCLYDEDLNVIKDIYDNRGNLITRVYNSDGKVIRELYSISGTLMRNNVLKSMFEESVFRPKVYDSEGNMITEIFANKKLLEKVYDEKGAIAKVESDLVYLVSRQSLPDDDPPTSSKPDSKHVNYFSEGSTYPFPEGQNHKSQDQNQRLMEGRSYGNDLEVAFNGYSSRRTDNCTCENCRKRGNNRKSIVQFGGELLDRLSRFTIPLTKFLPRSFLKRDSFEDSEEPEEELDSLETLIDEARQKSDEYYGSCSRVSLLESDENIPISRKMVEKTLKKCVHLNNSTDDIGKVSDTVLQHFANLILQEIEYTFYHKLDVLQCRRNSSGVFEYEGEKGSSQ